MTDRSDQDSPDPTAADSAATSAQESGGSSLLSIVITTLVTVLSLGVIAGVAGSALGYYRLDIVVSGSMKPAYDPGDLVFATQKPAEQLGVGDVILFNSPPEYGSDPVTHRVVAASVSPAGVISIRTKGDANEDVDPWHAQVTTDEVWIVERAIPKVGYAAQWAKSWWPLLLAGAVGLPMVGIARRRFAASRRPVALLWFVPAVVVAGAGAWVTVAGSDVVNGLTQEARTWQHQQVAPASVLLDRSTLYLNSTTENGVPTLGSRTKDDTGSGTTAEGTVQQRVTIKGGSIPAGAGVSLSMAAAEPNQLSRSLRVKVSTCAGPWQPTAAEFTCAAGAVVRVGDAPVHDTTINVLDAEEVAHAKPTHLLLELRVPPDADTSVAGLDVDLDVRLDAR